MTFHKRTMAGAGRIARRGLPVAVVALLLPLGACNVDKILRIEDPDVATPASVNDTTALPAVYGGAVGDFELAYAGSGSTGGGGGGEGQILLSGLLGDEFYSADTFDTRSEIDNRTIRLSTSGGSSNGQLEDAERYLQRARVAAENGAARFAGLGRVNVLERSELLSLAGYAYVMFGENYCNGVTFSNVPLGGGATVYGTPLSGPEVFQLALARFDSALAIANATTTAGPGASKADLVNLAKVGRGRALLDLGQFANAAAAVAGVPTSFEYDIEYSDNTTSQENGTWAYTVDLRRYGVSNAEGGSGIAYRTLGKRTDAAGGAGDTRVLYRSGGAPFDATVAGPLWAQQKYADRAAPVPLATGSEARLIEAEAAYQAGQFGTFLTALNAQHPGGGLVDPGTAAGRVSLLFQERALSLWLTSHRLGDERRLMRQYGYTEASAFPSTADSHGDPYGHDKNLPLFVDEANNPNFVGCTNRNP
ncbi:MAG: RagB/SusD protein [Gemmatimonadetes bacterium]|nr:RagB/SusD protein [Gemmatimonadota bacterium]